jgi:tRNA-Thr(GGU) m(6)t(6)A37 methyltransferase TsaA
MKQFSLILLIAFATSTFAAGTGQTEKKPSKDMSAESQFTIFPIGCVEKGNKRTFIRLDAHYRNGLLGLDQWTHIWVLYWFDRNDTPARRATLQVHPRGNKQNPLTGVFATRSPARPNLIALSLCRLISVEGNQLEIESIDAFDQTPVIDIKPYAKGIDVPKSPIRIPDWAGPKE